MTGSPQRGRWGREAPPPPARTLPPREPPPGGTPPPRRAAPAAEHGSQSLELALALPIVALLGVMALLAGLVGVEVTAVHAAAREAARAAAAGEDVHRRLADAGLGDVAAVHVAPPAAAASPGEPITVEIVAPSRVLALLGADVDLHADATTAREPGGDDGWRP